MSTISDPAGGPLVSRTVRLPWHALDALLSLLPDEQACVWLRHGEGLVGFGPTRHFALPSADSAAAASQVWRRLTRHAVVRDEVGVPGTGPVAFVSLPFDATSAAGGALVVPSVVVGVRGPDCWVTTTSFDGSLPAPVDLPTQPEPAAPGEVRLKRGAQTRDAWKQQVAEAVARIGSGQVEKVVLARDVVARAEQPIDPRWLAGRLSEEFSACWTFSVDGLVGATPELLVRSERGLVTSRVLAGTIPQTGDEEHDLALAASLARSSKDLEEHEYAVRSVAEALTPHCDSINVPDSPFVLHLPNVMHLATDVTGSLHRSPDPQSDAGVLDLVASLHPSAAVCGTPTAAAADLIRELELMDRDRYAGPVGWVDLHGDGELGIALRCGRLDPDDSRTMRLFAGCGIVAGSDPGTELAESEAKMAPMSTALRGRPV